MKQWEKERGELDRYEGEAPGGERGGREKGMEGMKLVRGRREGIRKRVKEKEWGRHRRGIDTEEERGKK